MLSKVKAAAIELALKGWRVIPTKGKKPDSAKGFKDAEADPEKIKHWDFQGGLAVVPLEGVVCLDIDPPKENEETGRALAEAAYNQLMRRWPSLAHTWIERTLSGGYHIFLRLPPKGDVGELKKRVEHTSGLALEVLGNGKGAIVVAPTPGYEVITKTKAPEDLIEAPRKFWTELGFTGESKTYSVESTQDCTEALRRAYISKAHDLVLGAVKGNRNNTINRAFFILGKALIGVDETRANEEYTKLLNTAKTLVAVDFPEKELLYTAGRAFRQGLTGERPSFLLWVDEKTFRITHAGIAEYFTSVRQGEFAYIEPFGWVHWNGRYWQLIPSGRGVHGFILGEVREFLERVARAGKGTEYIEKAKRFLEQASNLEGAVSFVKKVFGTYLKVEDLPGPEVTAHLLPAANGVINLRTGELESFDEHKDKYFTWLIEIPYKPGARALSWEKAMRVWGASDEEWVSYMQRLLGSFLTGDTSAQQVYFFWGEAANGKSTLIETVAGLLGGFARRATSDLIKRRKSDEHPTKVAELVGKRLAYISDFPADAALDDEIIKTHCGEDTLTGRFMRQDYFNFKPTHKLVLLTNHLPKIQADPALYRRVVVVPFRVTFMNSLRRDPRLREKLKKEREGILAWLVQGAKQYLEDPLAPLPEFLERARSLYFKKDNPAALFFEACVRPDPGGQVSRKDLYNAYSRFCEKLGNKPLTNAAFTRQLELLYPKLKEVLRKIKGERVYPGYSLVEAINTNAESVVDLEIDSMSADKLEEALFTYEVEPDLFTGGGKEAGYSVAEGIEVVGDTLGLEKVIKAVRGQEVGFDLETTALFPARGRARILSLSTGEVTYVIDLDAVPGAWEVLKYPAKLVGHNLVFDWTFVLAAGVDTEAQLCDTAIAHRVLTGTNEFVKLAELAEGVGEVLDKALQKADWGGELTPEMIRYAAKDAEVVLKIASLQSEQLLQKGLVETFQREMRALPAVALLRAKGVGIYTRIMGELENHYKARLEDLEALLDRYGEGLWGRGTNWNSPEQVLEALRRHGVFVEDTSFVTLTAHRKHPLVALVLDYREVTKQLGFFKEYAGYIQDGRIYADWNPLGAASGRMTCAKPNLQQAPRGDFRSIFWPGEGRVLIKADYSQIELRVAAVWANERRMLDAFKAGKDLHSLTAALILRKREKEVTKEDRTLAKAVNFGLLYGMGVGTLRTYALANYGLDLTLEQAKNLRSGFFKAYPALAEWHRETQYKLTTQKELVIRTLGGRERKVSRLTEALNTPIQGSAADGLKEALALLYEELRRRAWLDKVFPVLVVHDEIVLEAPEAMAAEVMQLLAGTMREGMERIVKGVPIEVEVEAYMDWGVTPSLPF